MRAARVWAARSVNLASLRRLFRPRRMQEYLVDVHTACLHETAARYADIYERLAGKAR